MPRQGIASFLPTAFIKQNVTMENASNDNANTNLNAANDSQEERLPSQDVPAVTEADEEQAVTHHHHNKATKHHDFVLPDGTRVIQTLRRKSLPDGSVLKKTRTEKFVAAASSDATTTHVIKTTTKRINSGAGLSFTTTTKEEIQEKPPVTFTRLLPDGSRVIKSKTCTVGPVKTTTTVHLTNIPAYLQHDTEAALDVPRIEIGEDDEDNEPKPLQFSIGAVYERGEEEATQKKLQLEEIEDEEPLSPQHFEEEETISDENKDAKTSRRWWWFHTSKRGAVAPAPVDERVNNENPSQHGVEREPIVDEATAHAPNYDEEGLAVATPVSPEDDQPIYQAEKYTPEAKIPFYKRGRYIFWTIVALLVIGVVVALAVVYGTKGAVEEEQTLPPTISKRDTEVMSYVEANVLSRNATWDSLPGNSPQSLALEWILQTDIEAPDKRTRTEATDKRLSQRYILALLAYSFDSSKLTDTGGWLSDSHECEWNGVTCSDEVVSALDINDNGLIGEIPPEISKLNLTMLSMKSNCLFGTLPAELGQMRSLQQLELEYNGLSGYIPDELANLKDLVKLNLADQYLTWQECNRSSDGTVVNTMYIRGDESNGENPGLSGEVLGAHFLSQLTNLQEVSVSNNYFSGTIASEVGKLAKLATLRAGVNSFTGMIPNEITNLTNLQELSFEETWLYGELPHEIGKMKSLETLILYNPLSEGTLGGNIPDSLYDLSNLKTLMLFGNEFDGSLKTDIGNLKRLTHLKLSSNPLTGTLPSELGLCEDLESLDISNTQIQGTVPQEVCDLREKKLNSEDPLAEFLKADCAGSAPFLACDCCNTCCDHATGKCIMEE